MALNPVYLVASIMVLGFGAMCWQLGLNYACGV